MLIDASLVLEGGGARCVFTAGILDYLMENDIYFKNVYSVSASAYIALNYISKQIGRTKICNIDYMKKEKMITLKSLVTTRNLLNVKLLFDKLPNKEVPFDYDTFFASKQRLVMSVTDIKSGEPVYFDHYNSRKELMKICCCSNSFPAMSTIKKIDGRKVLDGGMADAIPVKKALSDDCKKCIVILTKPKGYRKKLSKNRMLRMIYHRYPNFTKLLRYRPKQYNDTLDAIDRLEKEGKLLAVYPQQEPPSLINCNISRLTDLYNHGHEYAKELLPQIKEYLEKA